MPSPLAWEEELPCPVAGAAQGLDALRKMLKLDTRPEGVLAAVLLPKTEPKATGSSRLIQGREDGLRRTRPRRTEGSSKGWLPRRWGSCLFTMGSAGVHRGKGEGSAQGSTRSGGAWWGRGLVLVPEGDIKMRPLGEILAKPEA